MSLTYCQKLTDATIKHLRDGKCEQLKSLELDYCDLISVPALKQLLIYEALEEPTTGESTVFPWPVVTGLDRVQNGGERAYPRKPTPEDTARDARRSTLREHRQRRGSSACVDGTLGDDSADDSFQFDDSIFEETLTDEESYGRGKTPVGSPARPSRAVLSRDLAGDSNTHTVVDKKTPNSKQFHSNTTNAEQMRLVRMIPNGVAPKASPSRTKAPAVPERKGCPFRLSYLSAKSCPHASQERMMHMSIEAECAKTCKSRHLGR